MIYSIGGIPFRTDFKHEYGKNKCRNYLSNETPLFDIEVSLDEIQKETLSFSGNTSENAEFDCVFRKFYNQAPKYGRILMHGAAISMDGEGFLFTAPSGTGKTTHIKLWGKNFGNKVKVIDGDKPLISIENGVPLVWGTPRSGKEGWNNPVSAPLSAIAFLNRSEKNYVSEVSPKDIIDEAFMQFYIPKNKETAILTIDIINSLLHSVPLYKIYCNMEIDAAQTVYEAIKKIK